MPVKLKPLSSQVIVVTGASSGIGLATAQTAARSGARVVMAARNEAALNQAAADIRKAGGDANAIVTDVTKREDLERLSTETIRLHGGYDSWVNNAGQTIFGHLADVTEEDHRRLFDINFWGLVNGSLIAASHLRGRGGAIINLGSVASDLAFPIQGMYSATKHAIKAFTDALRMELEEENAPISVTLIKPTSINTPLPEVARNYMDREPTLPPPVYSPRDVAEAIVFAAEHGGRDYYIGGAAKAFSLLRKISPRAIDWLGATVIPRLQQQNQPARQHKGALYTPSPGGRIDGKAKLVLRSAYTKATMHPLLATTLLAGTAVAAAALMPRRR